jgi:aminoglycoside phosphotransferase (APT) family kinase protein
MSAFPLPAAPEEITPDWLNAVLREAGVLRKAEVTQVTWERVGEGHGLTGALASFHLGYAAAAREEEAPASLIAKCPTAPQDTPSIYRAAQQRAPAAFQQHYQRCAREVQFYQTIAPLGDVPMPRLYYGAADNATGRVVLLLQDMRGTRAGDVLQGCSSDEAALVLRAIAPLHTRWWANPRLKAFSWLPQWVGDPRARQERYKRQVGLFLERFGQQLPAFVSEVIDRLRSGYARVLTGLAEAPATLIHADLHLDNILFSPPGGEPPVTLLDWQGVALGPAVVDVALFVFGSLAVDQRRSAEGALFQQYCALLAEHGVSGYSVDQLREDCRLALLWTLAGTVGWLSSVDLDSLLGRERALVEAALGDGRLVAALQDYDVLAVCSHE